MQDSGKGSRENGGMKKKNPGGNKRTDCCLGERHSNTVGLFAGGRLAVNDNRGQVGSLIQFSYCFFVNTMLYSKYAFSYALRVLMSYIWHHGMSAKAFTSVWK